MRAILAVLVLMLVSGSAAEAAQARVIVENNYGGDPQPYTARAARREPMVIRGFCASACTIYLSNPRACVHRDAVLLFHAASYSYEPAVARYGRTKEGRWEERRWNKRLMSLYPPKVRKWIRDQGGLSTEDWLSLEGSELAATVPVFPIPDPSRPDDRVIVWKPPPGYPAEAYHAGPVCCQEPALVPRL